MWTARCFHKNGCNCSNKAGELLLGLFRMHFGGIVFCKTAPLLLECRYMQFLSVVVGTFMADVLGGLLVCALKKKIYFGPKIFQNIILFFFFFMVWFKP